MFHGRAYRARGGKAAAHTGDGLAAEPLFSGFAFWPANGR
jgi:hypothetical protein